MADGFISDDDIQKVREASDIVAVFSERVPVKQRGRDFWCCCPIHQEKTPSCKIDPALQLWHCFGCGEGGDIFAFLMKADGLTFRESVVKLAERAHIPISYGNGKPTGADGSYKARLKAVCKEAADFYHMQLMRSTSDGAAKARSYLSGRGLGGQIPKTWNLGYAPGGGMLVRHLMQKGFSGKELIDANVAVAGRDNKVRDRFYERVMFPICDVQGEPIAFGGRIMGQGQPKYLNSQETPIFHKSTVLYGLHLAKNAMASTGVAIVVEGYTDVIALAEAGVKNVVATLGTALTMQHIRTLSSHAKNRIVYLFDGDEAGQRAADRALGFIDSSMTPEAGRKRIDLCAVTLPDNLDPADFVGQRGVEELRALIDGAKPLLSYGIERRLAAHDLSRAEGRAAAVTEALQVLAPIKDSLLAKDYAIQIASRTRTREEDVLAQLARLKAPRPAQSRDWGTDEQVKGNEAKEASDALSDGRVPVRANAQSTHGASQVSASEINRRRFERQLLCLFAQNPSVALSSCSTLAQTRWHDALHGRIAEAMLEYFTEHPDCKAAQLISAAQNEIPEAGNMLTASFESSDATPDALAAYLSEELSIGDLDDTIAELRAQLKDINALSAEEYDQLFQTVVVLQKDLTERRKTHQVSSFASSS